MGMKFLVLWELDLSIMRADFASVIMRMPEYAHKLRERGKLVGRYHIVGKHGGAWIYDVDSNEELERLLAMAPVYNFAKYEVLPLAEMDTPAQMLKSSQG
ncbi:muconolactone Delta-isomerase family protein [Meiothermus cerbereus]|jgi:muconolactone delta-isomerase|uniref:muconolactone Delta-isomerase family protein n=1 Tax=Meiothermus cerbereus TaxID=65552 RepID=UPI003F4FFA9F